MVFNDYLFFGFVLRFFYSIKLYFGTCNETFSMIRFILIFIDWTNNSLQGYDKQLKKIFEKAGYYIPQEEKKLLSREAVKREEEEKKEENGEFDTLPKCTEVPKNFHSFIHLTHANTNASLKKGF